MNWASFGNVLSHESSFWLHRANSDSDACLGTMVTVVRSVAPNWRCDGAYCANNTRPMHWHSLTFSINMVASLF